MANEKRLIDANAMREDWLENGQNEYVYDTNAVLDSIDAQPTVDAVEVVRCKDCKHCITDQNIIGGYGDCLRFDPVNKNSIVQADDFCSYGERRTDHENP